MTKKSAGKTTAVLLFAAYCLGMLALLFLRAPGERRLINLIPFRTIRTYFAVFLGDSHFEDSLWYAAHVNLMGNIVMFVPLGLLLPVLFEKQRSFRRFLLTAAGAVALAELLQFLTRRGFMDVDDLLLNTLGASAGWGLWKLYTRLVAPRILQRAREEQAAGKPRLLLLAAAVKVFLHDRLGKRKKDG